MTRLALAVAVVVTGLLAALGAAFAQQREGPEDSRLAYVGRVVDPDGKPLAGAVVLADNGGSYQVMKEWIETPWRLWVPDPFARASIGPYTERSEVPTGADGRFRVEGVRPPAGAGWVVVVHPDFATVRKDATGDAKGGVLDVGDVTLRPGAAVRATVRTPDGKPAAGAWVVCRSATPSSPDASPSSWAWGDEPGDVRVGRTADDGTCVVRGLTPGRLRVASFTAQHVPTVVEADGRAGETSEASISLVLGASLRVEVVTRGTDAPVAGARVVVDTIEAGSSWPGPPPVASVRTGAAGTAVIDGIEVLDEYRVTVVPPDFADDHVHSPGPFHVVATTKPGGTVKFALAAARTLTVRLIDAYTKEPLEGAKVLLWPDWKRFDHSGGQPIDLTPTWDATAKAYVTPHARPGPWTIGAWAPGRMPGGLTNVRVADEGAAAVTVGPSVELVELGPAVGFASGRVVEKSTGKPIAGAVVSSYEWIQRIGDGQRATATTGADGTFHLSPLLGREYPLRLDVRAPGYVDGYPEWSADDRPDGGDGNGVGGRGAGATAGLGDIGLLRAATIRGRLTDADGRPLARTGVHLSPREFEGHGKGDGWDATTDDEGRFEFPGLRPGEYVLAGPQKSPSIRLAEGATVERDVVR